MKEVFLDSVDSTNAWAKRHLAEFDPASLTAITASHQTGGHGTYGKSWLSPRGNLYLTLVFIPPDTSPPHWGKILADLTLEWLREEGIEASFKWPNDLFIEGHKLAGILTEISQGFVILGLGMNLNMEEKELQTIDQKATSLLVHTRRRFDPLEIGALLANRFATLLDNTGSS